MRILWLTPGFAAHEADHNCIPPMQLLARELTAQGIDLEIFTLAYPFRRDAYLWHEIPVVPAHSVLSRFFRWTNWLRMIRLALRAHKAEPFEAIHSFWLGPCWLIGRFLAQRWNIPHWTTLMGQDVLSGNAYRHLLRPADGPKLIALSPLQAGIFFQTTGLQAGHLIRWGLDLAGISSQAAEGRPIDIIGCGTHIPLKNWDLWLEAVALVAKSLPTVQALLIGDGPQRSTLEALAARLGVAEQVRFTGTHPRALVLAQMQQAKVLLHTSRFESFGFVLVEGALSGCRVVSTPTGIAPELGDCGQTAAQLAELVLRALRQAAPPVLPRWITMRDTAEQYIRLYKLPPPP